MRVEDGDKIKIDGLCLDAIHTPGHTFVCPGHDYKGDSCSTIREERDFHPRLQVKSAREYAKIIDNLILLTPEMMEIVIPKNEKIEITFKKPSFFFGFKFLDDINLSTLLNNLIFYLF